MSTPTTTPDISTLSIRDQVWSENAAAMLTVVELAYRRVPAEDVLSGKARPIEARLSADPSWPCGALPVKDGPR
jgi:hypothetical protein